MSDQDGLTIRTRDAFERNGNWLLVRRGLGVSAFGLNVVEIPPGEQIPEHDETERDQEEVFIVLSGSAKLLVDGTEHDAPAGTYARLDPELTRTVVNTGDEPAAVLIVSAPRTSGYEPMSWG
jgi:quercetin dioxygenase-like cupin family protein